MTLQFRAAILSALVGCSGSLYAQSINLSFESQDLPTQSFGAAAVQLGVWNEAYTGIRWGGPGRRYPHPIVDLQGHVTHVIIQASPRVTQIGWWNPDTYNQTSGEYAALMTDAIQWEGGTLTFHNLWPGSYSVYVYAVPPNNGPRTCFVSVSGSTSENPQYISGPLHGNVLLQGQTHSVHDVQVSAERELVISIKPAVSITTFVEGLQLVYHGQNLIMASISR